MAPVRLIVIAIDFSLSPELEAIRLQARTFVTDVIQPGKHRIEGNDAESNKVGEPLSGADRIFALVGLRKRAFKDDIWLPHMQEAWGGMGARSRRTCHSSGRTRRSRIRTATSG
ncbi:MAG: acyl-CoA dehydrogenase [Ilumatobacter sp.]